MASVYKPTGRNIYRVKFRDQHGRERTISSGTDDKRVAESLGQKIEEDADRIRVGMAPMFPEISGPYLGLVPLERRGGRTWAEASLTLGMTADLYADLEMEDVAEEVWDLPPLFRGSAARPGERRGSAEGSADSEAA